MAARRGLEGLGEPAKALVAARGEVRQDPEDRAIAALVGEPEAELESP